MVGQAEEECLCQCHPLWNQESSSISGVWVVQDQELAFPLSPDWQVDHESHTQQKLDPGSEEIQTLVREYFTWEGAK